MAINHPFKVSKNANLDAVEFRMELPRSMDEMDLIVTRFGTVERMIDRANAQLIVDVAPGMRKRLPDVEKAQAYAASYCDNGSKDTYVAPKLKVEDLEEEDFSEENIEFLRSKGLI